ncbi:hypothetical protein [Novosphingobium naphthalenivorans]|uniref:hypothetical protein n=1 Tax=Novosphingobium naphthalenivorans TaxID=273168 RepID=UPI000835E3ED|nr:hypothetical protein [Novosphingobium naphthalenivorans]
MALNNIHLRKLLKILYLPANQRRSELRKDIRDERDRLAGGGAGGGDFYAPFWSDAKRHVFGRLDLLDAVDDRIAVNGRRDNLYPLLRDGFLTWWNERRRWTNEPFAPGRSLRSRFLFPALEATVKVDNILAVRDGLDTEHAIYPYFAPSPELSDEAARLGLWLLTQTFPEISPQEFRILDVIRGRTFSLDRHPLHGNEEVIFSRRYSQALNERAILEREYDR